ncbi:MAG: TRAP transporter permease [Proteobacteria bacterium]|nr:TRAP transporter permease [Pseudomonadota bacterium]
MAESASPIPDVSQEEIEKAIEEVEYTGRKHGPRLAVIVSGIAAAWSLFQLWIASPLPFIFDIGIIIDVPARGVHLAFGLLLCFLMFPAARSLATRQIPIYDIVLALVGAGCALYLWFGYEGLVDRDGILMNVDVFGFSFPFEAVLGGVGMLLLMEATRRSIGLPLVIVAGVFIVYSIFGQSMPDIISHRGLSLTRLIGYHWLGGEAIFGIPIDVSVSFVFLFVLFGALLDKAGAGKYFLDLSFAMVGKYRGGPAKAAILASGMTGAISGSSIANVVTTGTFTIPVMRSVGMSAVKAGAIEVAASTNGQLMPPIMGAAAFIIAELIGISYFDVVKAAFIPAVSSYIALIYISHLEAMKLGLKGLPKSQIPPLGKTFRSGLHFLIPITVLVYLLMVMRWTAGTAVFYSILLMMIIILMEKVWHEMRGGGSDAVQALNDGLRLIYDGLVAGARNMVNIAVAVASAGIIVGAVGSTGLNNAMVGVIEAISGGNVYILLVLTAVLALILGMGLPTTANYLVVASLLAPVLVELGTASGLVLPLIAVHLFVFYFGILADDTPPVCLAAFAAAAISRADPIQTGIQGFIYDMRTAILPFIFIFNPELLLIGIESVWHGLLIFAVTMLALLSFSSLTQGWTLVSNRIHEGIMLAVVVMMLFRPGIFMNLIYPDFATLELEKFVAGEVSAKQAYTVRFHIVRTTDYGDRFKLYRLATPDMPAAGPGDYYGVTFKATEDGRYEVDELAFKGLAEQAGVEVGDTLTEVDVEQLGQPSKMWVYPFGLALLGLVILSQWPRWRRAKASEAAAAVTAE